MWLPPSRGLSCVPRHRGAVKGWSLFSGVGGLDLGMQRAGIDIVLQAEKEEWRREVLHQRLPCPVLVGDVRHVRADSAPRPQIVFGGFPCQDVSKAGGRKGLAGEQSGLFFEFARVVGDVRPTWLLIENVPGLFSSEGGRDFGVVLETLADLGYGVAWRVLNSRYFGVPQRRERVFIVGADAAGNPRAAAERAGLVLALGTRCERHFEASGRQEQGASHVPADRTGTHVARTLGSLADGGYRTTDLDGVPAFVSETFPLDPPMAVSENQRAELRETPIAAQLTAGGGKPGQGYPAVRVKEIVRYMTPLECERLQAFPDGWTDLGPKTRRYGALGDAVTVTVPEWLGARIVNEPPNWRELVASVMAQRDCESIAPPMPDVPDQMELI